MANYLIIGGAATATRAANILSKMGHTIYQTSRHTDIDSPGTLLQFDPLEDEFPADKLPEQLDGLVFAPGTIRLRPFRSLKDDEYREDFEINVMGAVRTIRAALPLLKKANRASVVMFSTVAVQTGMAFHASIAAAKGAVEGLTRSLAAELAPNIRVNAIAPSLTDTELATQLLSTDAKHEAGNKRHPMGRVGTPDDIANAIVFLLTDRSDWITGQILPVDGGMSSVRLFG